MAGWIQGKRTTMGRAANAARRGISSEIRKQMRSRCFPPALSKTSTATE